MTSIYLARGHGEQPSGRHDPGAVGGGWNEQTAVDVVAPVVADLLQRAGVEVHDEGTADPNFYGSVDAAEKAGADLFVALHFDWTGGLDIHAFHHSRSVEGKDLATSIVEALDDGRFAVESRPVRARDGLYVIGHTSMPSVLVELGRIGEFGTDQRGHLEDLGRAVASGVLAHLGLDVPVEPDPEPEPEPEPETNWTEDLVNELPLLVKRTNLHKASDYDRRAQGLLAAAGVLEIAPNLDGRRFDGKFGPSTDRAVREFQRRNGLKVDGLIGQNTWTALLGG